ncbi:MAG: hypothetical protein ACREWG_02685 [Gammaproteobacteria bacterium]
MDSRTERLEARQFILDSPLCEAAADITRYAAVSLCPGGLLLQSFLSFANRLILGAARSLLDRAPVV